MEKLLVFILTIIILPTCIANGHALKTAWQDQQISYHTQYQLDNDPALKNQKGVVNISVATSNHVALLVGEVPTTELKQRAEVIAKQVPTVKQVYNQIVVGPPISSSTKSSDAWITTKVKSKMLFAKGLNSAQIKIVTENGVVYLMGNTSKQQGNLAVQVVSQVSEVKKIVKIFEYIN